jgi:hypothetical protein
MPIRAATDPVRPARRGLLATLLAWIGLPRAARAVPGDAPRVVERDGWFLDARDR